MTQDKRIVPLEASLMSPDCDGITGERCLTTLPANKQSLDSQTLRLIKLFSRSLRKEGWELKNG